ncbi:MAG TPA: asparagine synthase (glutamine-hydrolyzing) [Thermoanaerobaculia bacterium]|nr:asparagine synthase (glutamine-hydrolyzing) [Thermoanaerobaculia bacterium]
MCGINAIFAYSPSAPPVDPRELLVCREAMRLRGPDAGDSWISDDGRVGLGHRRLAIIDLSPGGAQPMQRSANVIIFNGEIYNYDELRADLKRRGVEFTSQSDTEVLLRLFELEGEAMLPKLRGMFALALWDGDRRRLFLARDPYGIKPLYYADDGQTCRIASQVKALIAGGRIAKQFDPAAATAFFLRGTVQEPFTMYRAIRALPAGSYCWIDERGTSEPVRYFSIAATLRDAVESDQRFTDEQRRDLVHDAVLESVRYHMVADVPVGAFLSAGIDSSAIVAFARETGSDLQTMTLRFEEYRGRDNDEAPLAHLVAERYGLRHTIQELSRQKFLQSVPHVFEAMDQPSVDGLNSYFISKAAHEMGLKVAMSGAGGDELFGGYTSFRDIPRWMPFTSLLSRIPRLGDAVHSINRALTRSSRHVSPKMGEIVRYGASYAGAYFVKRGRFLTSELGDILGREVAEEGLRRLDMLGLLESAVTPDPGNPFARVAALESSFYLRNQILRDMDWASMAHSLEVRVPLVDAHLLRRVAPALVNRRERGKGILADAPRPPLPDVVRNRKKTGFTLPLKEWLQKESGGQVEFGKRTWARKVFSTLFASGNGYW